MEKNAKLESVKVICGNAVVTEVDAIEGRDDLARVIVNFDNANQKASENDSDALSLLLSAVSLASSTNRYAILVGLDGNNITVDSLQQCIGLSVLCTAYRVSITGLTGGKYTEVYREDGRPMQNLPRCVMGKHDGESDIISEFDRAYLRLTTQLADNSLFVNNPAIEEKPKQQNNFGF